MTPVLTPAEALAHPHHLARNLVHQERGVSEIGPLAQMTSMSWTSRSAPAAGEHTRVLLSELGYSSNDVQLFTETGVVK